MLVDDDRVPLLLREGFLFPAAAPIEAPAEERVVAERVGTSSWYDIKRGSEVLDRVQGQAKAEARAAELNA